MQKKMLILASGLLLVGKTMSLQAGETQTDSQKKIDNVIKTAKLAAITYGIYAAGHKLYELSSTIKTKTQNLPENMKNNPKLTTANDYARNIAIVVILGHFGYKGLKHLYVQTGLKRFVDAAQQAQ